MDWKDLTKTGRLRAYMVPPANLEDLIGEIEAVDWDASSFSAAYYTDTRTSGSLVVYDDEWIRNTFVRVVYYPDRDDEGEFFVIGTYIVVDDDSERENGRWRTTLELRSMLYALSLDMTFTDTVFAAGSTVRAAINHEIYEAGQHLRWSGHDVRVSSTHILEGGKSRLERLFTLCEMANNRLDVDPYGYITVKPYTKPASKTAELTLDLSDPMGVTFDNLKRETDWLQMPTTTAVVYDYTKDTGSGKSEQRRITAWIKSNNEHQRHHARGYNLVDVHSLSEMSPETTTRAAQLARQFRDKNEIEHREWSLDTKFLPIWEGSVINLVVPDGLEEYQGTRKCLVKSIEMRGPYMDMSLVLKETASGDEED